MKKMKTIFIILLCVVIGVTIVKDFLFKTVATMAISGVTGAPVHINRLSVGVFRQTARIEGFKIYNPSGFSKNILIDISKIYVDYRLTSILKGKIHLNVLEVQLKEVILEKNKQGKLNVDNLKVAQTDAKAKEATKKQMPLAIDVCKLGIGRLVYKDFSVNTTAPSVKVYEININKTYKNISSVQQLVALILSEPMKAAGIQGAAIYSASALAGVAILPVAVAATLIGKDSVEDNFKVSFEKGYEKSLAVLKGFGKITGENKSTGIITAEADSASVSLQVKKVDNRTVQIAVSARKFLFPKPEVAGGILYQISQQLK